MLAPHDDNDDDNDDDDNNDDKDDLVWFANNASLALYHFCGCIGGQFNTAAVAAAVAAANSNI